MHNSSALWVGFFRFFFLGNLLISIQIAITKYEEALDTNPNDYQALIRCAEIAVQFIEGHARGVSAMKYNIEKVFYQFNYWMDDNSNIAIAPSSIRQYVISKSYHGKSQWFVWIVQIRTVPWQM